MIKKITYLTLGLAFSFNSLNASDYSDEVLKYYAQVLAKIKGAEVKYVDTDTYKGYEVVNVEILKDGKKQKHFMFIKDGLLFNDVLDLKTMKSYRETFKGDEFIKIAKANKEYLQIGSNANEVMWIFLDIECPYCKSHSEKLTELSKNKQINLVFLNVVGTEYGIIKTVNLEKEFKKAKNTEDKIKIIQKYFNYTKNDLSASDEEKKKIIERSDKYGNNGLEYVPFIIDKGGSSK